MAKRPHFSVLDWPPVARSKLRSRIEQHSLRATCVAGYTNFTADLEHGDIPTRELHIRHVRDLAEMARDGSSERSGRLIDKDQPASMERKKRQGYF